jgi:acyl carrier protein
MNIIDKILQAFRSIDIANPELSDHLEENLGMDSQEVALLITELEKSFNIKIGETEICRQTKVSDIVELINQKLLTKPTEIV